MQAVHELKQNKLRLEECKTFLEEFKLGIITKDEYHAAITRLKKEAQQAASLAWDSPSFHQLTYVSLF